MGLATYEKTTFSHAKRSRDIYRKGTGPAVIVIAEVPGITPDVIGFADRVAAIGCTAVMPHLFGEPGAPESMGALLKTLPRLCVSREFGVWAAGKTSPVIDWLRALARSEHDRCGGPGVGAIGMCITGGFALAMATDDRLLAPVLSQPSLPFGVTRKHRADLGLSPEDLARVKDRCANEGLCVLGLRFSHDRFVPAERFERLRQELGDGFVGIEIDSSPGNPFGHPTKEAHSVVTRHLVDEPGQPTRDALDQVLDLFRQRLLG